MRAPSGILRVASVADTTHGIPSSLLTIIACESGAPRLRQLLLQARIKVSMMDQLGAPRGYLLVEVTLGHCCQDDDSAVPSADPVHPGIP